MTKEKIKKTERKISQLVGTNNSENNINSRGKIFEGIVTSKFSKRVAIEFERMVYVRKYERYAKSKTKIHARLPTNMEDEIQLGDLIRVQECRPLSKIIHFIVIKKLKNASEVEGGKK
jgi:small subunit ribosomal protein S17